MAQGVKVLVIDVGGSHVKIMASGQTEERKFESGPTMTPAQMAEGVKSLASGWRYDAVAIGYPGVVIRDQPGPKPEVSAGALVVIKGDAEARELADWLESKGWIGR